MICSQRDKPGISISPREISDLQQHAHRQQIRDAEHLKDILVACWEQISQDLIVQTVLEMTGFSYCSEG